jgi:hypothetical protein
MYTWVLYCDFLSKKEPVMENQNRINKIQGLENVVIAGNPVVEGEPTQEFEEQIDPESRSPEEVHFQIEEVRKNKEKLKRNVEDCLKGLVPGMKISISRLRPTWCSGWLDTIPIDVDDEGQTVIDMHYLREEWGGHTLNLRFLDINGKFVFSKTVDFRNEDPKKNGIVVVHPEVKHARQMQEIESQKQASSNSSNEIDYVKLLMDQMRQSQAESQKIMRESMKRDNPTPQTQLSQMMEMFAMVNQMKQFGEPDDKGGDDVSSMIGGVLNLLQKKQEQQPAQQQQQRFAPPVLGGDSTLQPIARARQEPQIFQRAPQPPTAQEPAAQAAPAAQEPAAQEQAAPAAQAAPDDQDISLAEELAGMNPQEIADTMTAVLELIGPEKQKAIFENFDKIEQGN